MILPRPRSRQYASKGALTLADAQSFDGAVCVIREQLPTDARGSRVVCAFSRRGEGALGASEFE